MISGNVSGLGALDRILDRLKGISHVDLIPLADSIKKAVEDGNRDGLLAGTDAAGAPMAELKDSTIRRGRGGFGPPTVPRFGASGLIDRFKVTASATSGGFRITAGWQGQVPQAKYLRSGTKYMPARNPVGIRPATREEIRRLVADFARSRYTVKF